MTRTLRTLAASGAFMASFLVFSVLFTQEKLQKLGDVVVAPERRSPEYLQRFVVTEIKKWAGPIKASGVSLD
jgi:hypothetical protein